MSVALDHDGAEARIAFLMALRAKGLRDTAVLRAFETVPRSRFVPRRFVDLALSDVALPIACGQIHDRAVPDGRDAHRARPAPGAPRAGDRLGLRLRHGLLARLAAEVVSIERYPFARRRGAVRLECAA